MNDDPLIWLPRDCDLHHSYAICRRVRTPEQAEAVLEALADEFAESERVGFDQALQQVRRNVGYYLHTFGTDEQFAKGARFFQTCSPVFGYDKNPTARVAWWAGIKACHTCHGKRVLRPEERAEMDHHTKDVWLWRPK